MTPSQSIIQANNQILAAVDKNGRKFLVKRLTALDTLRLFKAAGPVLSQNEPWLSMAGLALSVLEIDGVPVPSPTTEGQIENIVDRLGDLGLAAVAEVIKEEDETSDIRDIAGN